jgi:hypothetical protein
MFRRSSRASGARRADEAGDVLVGFAVEGGLGARQRELYPGVPAFRIPVPILYSVFVLFRRPLRSTPNLARGR